MCLEKGPKNTEENTKKPEPKRSGFLILLDIELCFKL